MATNTIVLIVIVVLAGLILVVAAVAVKHKTRTLEAGVQVSAERDRAEAAELREVYEKAIANDDPVTAYAAEAELTDTPFYGQPGQPTE